MEFGDFVSAGIELLAESDNHRWQLGDLAALFEITVGRPDDPDAPTLRDLAEAWDCDVPRVSEWRSCAKAFPESVRTLLPPLSWSHYNAVRSHLRAGDYDPDTFERAMELLNVAVNEHMGIRAFRAFLKGALYEGEVATRLLPAFIQERAVGEETVWVTVKRVREDE